MSNRQKRDYVGKVAYCSNAALGLKDKSGKILPGGHYVYIRAVNGKTCDVNVITSLENKRYDFQRGKIVNVSLGNMYPIPRTDANFTKWSGVNHDTISNVDISALCDIGKKSIKKRHHFYIRKFMK